VGLPVRESTEQRQNNMKTTIQKNETTILATSSPSKGYVVATITAGNGLSSDLQSYDGQRRSDLLVHNKVFKTFRDPRLAKLFFSILADGEVNTDHWRRPTQEGGDWFLLEQHHTGAAKKFWDEVFPEENTNEKNTVKIEAATILDLGEFGETVIASVGGKDFRHNKSFEIRWIEEAGSRGTDAFLLLERVEAKEEINLEHWRELNDEEAETIAEERAYSEYTDFIEDFHRREGLARLG